MALKHFVQPRSDKMIEQEAVKWRNALLPPNTSRADVVFALAEKFPSLYPNFELKVVQRADINGEDARTTFKPPTILVSQNVFEAAKMENGRARFTLAHELGHLVLHKNIDKQSFARAPNIIQYENNAMKIGAARSAERQANKFAAYFLMPTDLLHDYSSMEDISLDFGVSPKAAELRLEELSRSKGKKIPEHILDMIINLKRDIGDI